VGLAVGHCILEAAGGTLVDLRLNPIRYNTNDSLISPEFAAVNHLSILEDINLNTM